MELDTVTIETFTKDIVEAMKINESIETLDFANLRVGNGAELLAEILVHTKCVRELRHVATCTSIFPILDREVIIVTDALMKNRSIHTIGLSFDEIGAAGARAISVLIKKIRI
jgi:hypothetical protein